MSATEQLQNVSSSEDQSGSIDVEAARKEVATDTSRSSPEPVNDPLLPPVDGGIKAWSVIGGAFLALFVQFGLGEFSECYKPLPGPSNPSASCEQCTPVTVWTSRDSMVSSAASVPAGYGRIGLNPLPRRKQLWDIPTIREDNI